MFTRIPLLPLLYLLSPEYLKYLPQVLHLFTYLQNQGKTFLLGWLNLNKPFLNSGIETEVACSRNPLEPFLHNESWVQWEEIFPLTEQLVPSNKRKSAGFQKSRLYFFCSGLYFLFWFSCTYNFIDGYSVLWPQKTPLHLAISRMTSHEKWIVI